MNPDGYRHRWVEADALFSAALDIPADRRREFVAAGTAADPELREAVLALLAAAETADLVLPARGAVIPGDLLPALVAELEARDGPPADERIGRYRLVREIGRGGTGTVFLAERDDGAFRQRVAVKWLRRGLDTDDVLDRFRSERQILASLSHPHIARLLDGGATVDGRPYLVMELVEGQPITTYCDERRLPVDQRLALFQTVAGAVQYAHQNLVVHRDLKPSNILVTADGSVKLLDFGIAKLLGDSPFGGSSPRTRTGVRPMTPEYASPEQARGDPVTTASDVYQLGVLLYELLTGRRPDRPPCDDVSGTGRVREREASPPSAAVTRPPKPGAEIDAGAVARLRRTDPRRLRALLRGDLDTIALTALRPGPDRRYATVQELVADIQRHRTGRPVAARPDRWHYRARKFARRNPVLVLAACAVTLLLTGYLATLTVHADRLEMERDLARVEARKAEEVKQFLLGVFDLADPGRTRGETVTARELLDAAAVRARSELVGQPELRAEMLSSVASVYRRLGLDAEVEPLVQEALLIRRGLRRFPGADAGIAENLLQLAVLPRAPATDRATADALFAEALRIRERIHGPSHPAVAEVLRLWGVTTPLDTDQNRELRRARFDRALRILRDHDSDVRSDLAETLVQDAYDGGEHAVAKTREALELRRAVYGPSSLPAARALNDLAMALERTDPPAADSLMRIALELHRQLAGEAHTSTLTMANNLAATLRDRGRYAEAEPLYREVLELRRREQPDEHGRIAYALFGLGSVLVGQGRPREAEPLLREAMEPFPDGDIRREYVRRALADALILQSRYSDAEILLRTSARVIGTHWPDSPEAEAAAAALASLHLQRERATATERDPRRQP
jgi:eukaryotic-like serine/threonine-protein kinase